MRYRMKGGCHCGALQFQFETNKPPVALGLRACSCSFCRRHGVRATSDPEGQVSFRVLDPDKLYRYRFGLATADFLLCHGCGVYVGAVMPDPEGDRAIINTNCLEQPAAFGSEARQISYDDEDEPARRTRRRAVWTPAEVVTGVAAE